MNTIIIFIICFNIVFRLQYDKSAGVVEENTKQFLSCLQFLYCILLSLEFIKGEYLKKGGTWT